MKYKTFILLRDAGGSCLAALAVVGVFVGCQNANKTTVPTAQTPVYTQPANQPQRQPLPKRQPLPTSVPSHSRTVAPTNAIATLDSRDQAILKLQKEPLTNGKASSDSTKWVAIGNGFKAEFRADSGSSSWNRVKVDLNNNKQWEERWDFKADGSIKRRVAPADDENYNVEYRLKPGETKWLRVK